MRGAWRREVAGGRRPAAAAAPTTHQCALVRARGGVGVAHTAHRRHGVLWLRLHGPQRAVGQPHEHLEQHSCWALLDTSRVRSVFGYKGDWGSVATSERCRPAWPPRCARFKALHRTHDQLITPRSIELIEKQEVQLRSSAGYNEVAVLCIKPLGHCEL